MCYSFSFEVLCNVLVLPLLNVNVRLPGPSGLFRSKKRMKKIEENGSAGVYMTWVGVSFGFGE
jgi:hypothetical protein